MAAWRRLEGYFDHIMGELGALYTSGDAADFEAHLQQGRSEQPVMVLVSPNHNLVTALV